MNTAFIIPISSTGRYVFSVFNSGTIDIRANDDAQFHDKGIIVCSLVPCQEILLKGVR
jgi:hypothetical protein